MLTRLESETCYGAVLDLDQAMRESLPDSIYFVVGGIATAAYRHESTEFDITNRTVCADAASDILALRQNRTRRDVDILVGDVLTPEQAMQTKQALETAVDGRLEVSLFGFDDYESNVTSKFGLLSRRLQNRAGECFYQMGAVVQDVPQETYQDPWQLQLPAGNSVNVLHPVGHTLAYQVRSVGGLRGKDQIKHQEMTQVIAHGLGATALAEGQKQFASWRAFADTLNNIRAGNYDRVAATSLREDTSRMELRAMRWQGKLLGALERQEKLVSIAQSERAQRVLKRVIHSA